MAFHYSGVGPPSYGRFIELVPVFTEVLEKSNVKKGERIIIYTDTQKNRDIVDAYYVAAVSLGAEVVVVLSTPRNDPDRTPFSIAVDAMKNADMIIDLASISWIYTEPYSELLKSGIRIICNMSGVDTCFRLRPDDENIRKAKIGSKLMNDASKIEVFSAAGTKLEFDKTGRDGQYQDGLSPNPGDWDNFPSCQVSCAPIENKGSGTLVVDVGDIILPLKRIVGSRIDIKIEGGRIVEIEGGADAAMLRNWFEQWNDPNSYVIAHIGFGCETRAEVASMEMMEWESYGGNMMIAFGKNTGYFIGGKNNAKSHLDIVCFKNDFVLDGTTVIKEGEFVEENF